MKIKNWILPTVMILVMFNLFYFGLGPLLDRTIEHDSPVAVLAQDPFSYITATRMATEEQQYVTSPSDECHGISGLLTKHPPVIIELGAMSGFVLGLSAYDAILITIGIAFILCAIIYLLIISKFNKKIAMLSSPFFILLFSVPFLITLVFGEYGNISGAFFLLATIYSLFLWKNSDTNEKDYGWVITAILMSATMMTHGVEIFFFSIIFLAFFLIHFFHYTTKEARKKLLLKTLKLGGLFVLISGFYMRIFYFTQITTRSGNAGAAGRHFIPPSEYARFNAVITDFNWILGLILVLGACMFLYLLYTYFFKNKNNVTISKKLFLAVTLILIVITFSNYYSFKELFYRAFQQRNFWPLYFSAFFGLFFYTLLKRFKILKDKKIFLGMIAILMILMNIFFFTVPDVSSTVPKEEYKMIDWLENNIESETVLVLYMPNFVNYDQLPFLPNWFFVRPLNKLMVGEDIEVMSGSSCVYHYQRDGFFGIKKPIPEERLTSQMAVNMSICDFDYVAFSTRLTPQDQQYVEHINSYLTYINEKNMTIVYDQEGSIVLKNNPECEV
jgi:hypothetical protein